MKVLRYLSIFLSILLWTFSQGKIIIDHFDNSDGLLSSELYYVFQDSYGLFWFCTDQGVSKYDGYEFTNYSIKDGLTDQTIFKVFEDKYGKLWFTGMNGSITIYHRNEQKFKAFEQNDKIQEYYRLQRWINGIGFKNDSVYLFHHYNVKLADVHAFHIDRPETIVSHKEIDSAKGFSSLPEIYDNFAYFGTADAFNQRTHQFIYGSIPSNKLKWIKEIRVREEFDIPQPLELYWRDGKIYACERDGLRIISENEKHIEHEGNWITSVCFDREGLLWVSTHTDGCYLEALENIQRAELRIPRSEQLLCLAEFNGDVFVGTNEGRVLRFNTRLEKLQELKNDFMPPYDVDIHYLRGYKDRLQYTKLAIIRQGDSYKFIDQTITNGLKGLLPFYANYLNPEIIEMADKYDVQHLVYDMVQGRGGFVPYIWSEHRMYAVKSKALLLLNGEHRSLDTLLQLTVGISDIKLVGSTLYVSTKGEGLYVFNNDSLWKHYNLKTGLTDERLNSICVQSQFRRLILGTSSGVHFYELKGDGSLGNYLGKKGEKDGLASEFINDIIEFSGQLYVLSSKEINSMPSTIELGNVKPPVLVFEGIFNDHENVTDDRTKLRFDQNNLEFRFYAVSNKKIPGMYRYKLYRKGTEDTSWEVTDERKLLVWNISSGEYVFEISSRSQNSDWSESEKVEFVIVQRFIDKLWVRITAVALIVLFVILFMYMRIRDLQASSKRKEKIRDLELQYAKLEFASLRSQMNPHFIFNVMNSINRMIIEDRNDEAVNLLGKFAHLIRSSLEFSRLEYIPLTKELNFIRSYLELEKHRYPDRFDFSIECKLDEELMSDISMPPLLVQPLCENAIKHAFQQSKGQLNLSYHLIDDQLLKIVVKDNGIGLDSTEINDDHQSFGLKILKERIGLFLSEDSRCKVTIKTIPELTFGTEIEIIVPIRIGE